MTFFPFPPTPPPQPTHPCPSTTQCYNEYNDFKTADTGNSSHRQLEWVHGTWEDKKNKWIFANTDHDTEADRSFKYLGTVSNNTNDETEEIKATITADNKAYKFCTLPLDVNISTEIIK